MKLFRWLTKASRALAAQVLAPGMPVWSPRDLESLSRIGYAESSDPYTAISLIATAASGVPLYVGIEQPDGSHRQLPPTHPLARLMKRPNEMESGKAFIASALSYLLLTGNSFVEMVGPLPDISPASPPRELWNLRSDRMQILQGDATKRLISGYKYQGLRIVEYRAEEILFTRLWNPSHDFWGLSPISPISRAIDLNNLTANYNNKVLLNGAPPGVLSSEGELSDEQFARLKAQLKTRRKADDDMITEGGLKWQQMGLTMEQMQVSSTRVANKRDIAAAFKIAPELLGDASSKTFSNYAEARESLYTEAVLPMLGHLVDAWNARFYELFGGAQIVIDRDAIEALSGKREAAYSRVAGASNILTLNEARAELGFEAIPNGDTVLVDANKVTLDEVLNPATPPAN